MPEERLVAAWEVNASVLPNVFMPEYKKVFPYTSSQYEQDRKRSPTEPPAMDNDVAMMAYMAREVSAGRASWYENAMMQALAYAMIITDPSKINYVRIGFIWY